MDLEKQLKDLQLKRISAEKDIELLKNKTQISQEKRNEVSNLIENYERKNKNCINLNKENNQKAEAFNVKLYNLYVKYLK